MIFRINHYYHPDHEMAELLASIDRKLDIVLRREKWLMTDYSKIQEDITAQRTVLQGIVVGVQGLNASNADLTQQVADLKAAIAANDPAATQAAIDALDQSVQDNTTLVANLIPAVTANTPTPAAEAAAAVSDAAAPTTGA